MKNKNYDCVISNPPFQRVVYSDRHNNLKYCCIKKLLEIDKPFIIILNSTNIFSRWFKELVEGYDIKFIFPSRKINYDKYKEGGEEKIDTNSQASFNSIFVCYKMLDKNEWV